MTIPAANFFFSPQNSFKFGMTFQVKINFLKEISVKVIISGLIVGFFMSAAVDAGEKQQSLHDQVSGQGYGTAGCGLGSIIFGQKPGMVQIFAATTNGTFGNQTFAISSGTSNCVDPKASSLMKTEFYVSQNESALKNDIAKGQGETVSGLSQVARCGNSEMTASVLQARFSEIYPSAEQPTEQVSSKIVEILKSEKDLACQLS